MKVEILAIGRLKKGPVYEACKEYEQRITWPVTVKELVGKDTKDEHSLLLKNIKSDSALVALDETGTSSPSRTLAQTIQNFENQSRPLMQCIIGGADGLNDTIRQKADLLLSFGRQTWPHMLARLMLLEQIYRSQTILNNHPYHRD